MKLANLKKRWLWFGLLVAAVVSLACGASATVTPVPAATPTQTPIPTLAPETETVEELTVAEAEYIEEVRAGWNEFHSKAGGFRQAFAQTYSVRERLFEALIDAGAGSAFEGAYQAVKQLDPPPRFQADHDLMIQSMAEVVVYDEDVGRAAENQDLAAFTVANARMGQTIGLMALQLSDAVCHVTEPPDLPFTFCDPSRTLPGGEYGTKLNVVLARFNVSLITSLVNVGPQYTAEDALGALEVLQPERIDLYSRTRDEISGFSPPTALADGHNQLIQYLEEQLDIASLQDLSVQAQDLTKYQQESSQSSVLYCESRQEFGSGEMREIVRVHFSDVIGICVTREY